MLKCPLCGHTEHVDHDMFHHIEREHTDNGDVYVLVRVGRPLVGSTWFMRLISSPISDFEIISIKER